MVGAFEALRCAGRNRGVSCTRRRFSLTTVMHSQSCRQLTSAGSLCWDTSWLLHGLAQSLILNGAKQALDLADEAVELHRLGVVIIAAGLHGLFAINGFQISRALSSAPSGNLACAVHSADWTRP